MKWFSSFFLFLFEWKIKDALLIILIEQVEKYTLLNLQQDVLTDGETTL